MERKWKMKKLALLLALLMAIPATSFAAENTEDMLRQAARGLLTEVYGYTQEEAEAFTYEITEHDEVWAVVFYNHPDWIYKTGIRKDDMGLTGYRTPFTTLYSAKASENSVRYVLRAIEENGWFSNWNADSKAAFGELIAWCGDITMNDSMERGLTADDYTPAQAVEDLFLSCYGDTALWSDEVSQWLDELLVVFGSPDEVQSVL
jgi:hypothetical protein